MPAMPQAARTDGFGCKYGNGVNQVPTGMTKREMLAMNADVKEVMGKLSDDDIQRLVDWKINWVCHFDISKAYFEIESKLQIIKADALLAELEKQ